MRNLQKPFIFQSIIGEDGEINYEWEDAANKIASQENIGITRDREIDAVVLGENDSVVAAAWISWDGDNYEFDVVVSQNYQGQGIGSYLINKYIEIPEEYIEINPDTTMNLHIVNEKLKEMLLKKGFEVSQKQGNENYIMSKTQEDDIGSFLKQKIKEDTEEDKPKNSKVKIKR